MVSLNTSLNTAVAFSKKTGLLLTALAALSLPQANGQSVDVDKQLGAQNSVIVEAQMGVYDDAELRAWVNAVGYKLVTHLEDKRFKFSFKVIDDPMPNAFALPGGYIYVTRGILSLVTNEDELACVMAHEIIHVTERHSVKQMRKSLFPRLLEVPGNIVGNVVHDDLGNLINAPISTSNKLLLSSYSRGHEKDSDMMGITLARKAGYDPTAMGRILDRLSKAVEILTQEKEKRGYFDDHPFTPDRVKAIYKRSQKLDPIAKVESVDAPEALDGMTFGLNPAKGIFRKNTFLHPDLNFTISFPEDWVTTNQANSIGGVHKSQLGALFVGLTDQNKPLLDQANTFISKNRLDAGPDVTTPTPYTLNGNNGYLVSLVDDSGKQPMSLHILWTELGGNKYQLIGFAPYGVGEDLKTIANSFRLLTRTERNSIHQNIITLAQPKVGESVEDFHTRLGGEFSPRVTRIINGLAPDQETTDGNIMKIVKRVQYR
ncbi:M48 family metalloprotease [Pelagicoccus mobilis]|uniref:M48 family metalloprotease n=1 Tax=Pelagicoccus mobilis TaxID=415221 RepID=A0A934VSL8_9BACT|nr:M48 family metalloprotease [Pelagicoccus mobilis]MBK1879140.1 M48 family metalloprotease [Pelagicoccus mobilis]